MELSMTMKHIAALLKILEAEDDDMLAILMCLQTPAMEEEMLNWMIDREKNPPEVWECLEMAAMIHRELADPEEYETL